MFCAWMIVCLCYFCCVCLPCCFCLCVCVVCLLVYINSWLLFVVWFYCSSVLIVLDLFV